MAFQLERHERTGTLRLTATGATPGEVIESALRGVLVAARGDQPAGSPADVVAVPLRGTGADLGQLFLDLTRDLIAQLEEFGPGLDDPRLDGLLRTDTGDYTAWGYLAGPSNGAGQPAIMLTIGEVEVGEVVGEWRLVGEVRTG
jgi:hypothetical protein